MSLKYYLVTLGCPKNEVDSEGMAGLLEQAGYTSTDNAGEADVLIVNTCGFIRPACDESTTVLCELGLAKRPDQLLIAAGCLVQRTNVNLPHIIPELNAVLSTRHWYNIDRLVAQLRHDATPPYVLKDQRLLKRRPRSASAYLKIADGCSAPCTFCIIPSIKGPWRSKPVEQIVNEVRELVIQGVLEVVLVAQDATAYGYDRGERDALAILIDQIVKAVPDLRWLRIMYAYPGRVTPRLVEAMAEHNQVVKYLDIPLQHGHPAVLARMRRPGVTVAQHSVEILRAAIPDIAIRSTFIVGYPGETEEEFQGLLNFVREMRFDRVGVFTYFRELGTPAYDLPNQVPEEVKEARRNRVMELQQRISLKKNRKMVGRELEVLVEGSDNGISIGRSYRDAPEVDGMIIIQGELPSNQIINVRISEAMEYDLLAVPIGMAVR